MTEFPSGVLGNVVASRTYFRRLASGLLEGWKDVCDRTIPAIAILGKFTDEEKALVYDMQIQLKTLTSGRWLWVGGTEWVLNPRNYFGSYNCSGQGLCDWEAFATVMNLAMMGCGTGVNLEEKYISQLPVIRNRLKVSIVGEIGGVRKGDRKENTAIEFDYCDINPRAVITIGDSRKGWADAYKALLEIGSNDVLLKPANFDVEVVVSNVRPAGEPLKSFGGTANPAKLPEMFVRVAKILNKAVGRKLNSLECCLIVDEAAIVVVAGNIRRSSGIRQFAEDDELGATAKDNLWIQDGAGNWSIDPDRDALRMANHSRVYHHKPALEEVLASVTKQHGSGEGAIQYAPEAIARGNADLLDTGEKRREFIRLYEEDYLNGVKVFTEARAAQYLGSLSLEKYGYDLFDVEAYAQELEHRLSRYQLNPLILAA
jgi:ribonucleotide reductase class II